MAFNIRNINWDCRIDIDLKRFNMEKGQKVIAPKGCVGYLTAGKAYAVLDVEKCGNEHYSIGFSIIDDTGNEQFCLERNSYHLNGQDWIIPTEKVKDYDSGVHIGMIMGAVIGGILGLIIGIIISCW